MCLLREMRRAWAHHKGDTNVCIHLQSGQSVSHRLLQGCPSELQVVGSEGRHTFLRIAQHSAFSASVLPYNPRALDSMFWNLNRYLM